MDATKGMIKNFDKFAETRDPGHLEDGLIKAREIFESDDESSKGIAKNLISKAEKKIINELNDLLLALSLPAEIENSLNSAKLMVDFGTPKSSDIADLHDKVEHRFKEEEASNLLKGFFRVAKKDADKKALKQKGNKK